MSISRRESLALASASIAAATVPIIGARAAVTDVPTANVKPLDYKLEKGAELRILRPAKFIDPDEVYWRANTKKYTEATGIPVRVDFISWEDIRPQTAVVANTGAGPDVVVGFSSDPQIYASKIADMTDLADYLGAKYGGWQELAVLYGTKWKTKEWISIPIGGGTGPTVYRQSWVKEAGYDKIPEDHQGFLELCQKLHTAGHPFGESLGHALGDSNNFVSWLLWSHNAMLVDEKGKIALDSKETIAALKYATELQKVQVSGNLSWNDSGNNKAYAAGDIGMTFNGVSIYYFLKSSPDPKLQQMAVDTQHQLLPKGLASRSPQTATPMNAMVFKHTK
jgi:multiple sugar transport system substrate-binding protein